MATMNQAIRQMLSRRTQLAALMVVVALAAASFIALSDTASAQTADADDAKLELLIYFPEDSDGVVATRGSQQATGLERVKVTFELRGTVAKTDADDNVRLVKGRWHGDAGIIRLDGKADGDHVESPTYQSNPTEKKWPKFRSNGGLTWANEWLNVSTHMDANGEIDWRQAGLANRTNYISVSSPLRFWDAGTPTVYLDNRDPSQRGMGSNSADEVAWNCTDEANDISRPNRPTVATGSTADSCYLTINGADPEIDIVSADDGTYTIRAQVDPNKQFRIGTNGQIGILGIDWDGYDTNAPVNEGDDGVKIDNDGAVDQDSGTLRTFPFVVKTETLSATKTLTIKSVKEVEKANSSFSLATFDDGDGNPCPGGGRTDGDSCPDRISAVRGDRETAFVLSLKNADGGASNWGAIRRIQLDLRGTGDIETGSYQGGASVDGITARQNIGNTIVSWQLSAEPTHQPWGAGVRPDKIGQLKLKPSGSQTGTASVTATVLTAAGETIVFDPIEVTITGKAATFDIEEPTATLFRSATTTDDRDKLTLKSSAKDAGGNAVSGDALRSNYKITGPDGKSVKTKFETVERAANGNMVLQLAATTTGTAALAPGTYKFEGSIGTAPGDKDSVEFTVVGGAAEDGGISVEFDPAIPSSVGDEVTATITVQDAAGNAVADGTRVTVSVSDSAGTGAALRTVGNSNPTTKGGVATVRMVAIGDGLAIVTVTADSQVSVETVRSTATSASQVRGVEGLSRSDVNQFASWNPTNSVTASELFGELLSRGASALYRWDQSSRTWQRYATDSSMRLVPGSVNFQIGRGDTLYIAG